VCLCICVSIYLSIYLSTYLSIYLTNEFIPLSIHFTYRVCPGCKYVLASCVRDCPRARVYVAECVAFGPVETSLDCDICAYIRVYEVMDGPAIMPLKGYRPSSLCVYVCTVCYSMCVYVCMYVHMYVMLCYVCMYVCLHCHCMSS